MSLFLPVHDRNALTVIPFQRVTVALIVSCVAIAALDFVAAYGGAAGPGLALGLVPAGLFAGGGEEGLVLPAVTLVSHMFAHGGIAHLLGNMVFLWVYGDNVEDAMGHARFLVFYLACGIAGGLAHMLSEPGSPIPLVGASGAISGVVAAYLILHPKVKIWVLALGRVPLLLPAYIVLGSWVLFQIAFVVLGSGDNTAWWAHIGGFAAGLALTPEFKRADVPLFDGLAKK
jgi:membrane associated rhomboid family serine protease